MPLLDLASDHWVGCWIDDERMDNPIGRTLANYVHLVLASIDWVDENWWLPNRIEISPKIWMRWDLPPSEWIIENKRYLDFILFNVDNPNGSDALSFFIRQAQLNEEDGKTKEAFISKSLWQMTRWW
jgi:hypothetical protein